jgi:hypothetical protein
MSLSLKRQTRGEAARTHQPTLFEDIGNIAGLYGTVLWMIGQRLQRGQHWEEKLTREVLRRQGFIPGYGDEITVSRPHHN